MNTSDWIVLKDGSDYSFDPAERSAKSMEMFGKSGTKLIPMFTELNSLTASSKLLGPILSAEQVKAADELGDAFGALVEQVKRMVQQVGAAFGPTLIKPIQTAIGMISALQDVMSGKGTQFSGDLLDRLAQFRLTSIEDFQKRGAMAAGGFSGAKGGADMTDGEGAPGESKATKGLATQDQIIKSIIAGQRARFNLANQFATAEERHAQKMAEFNNALIAINRNRVLNFISPEQAAAEKQMLMVAMQRAQAAENERRAKLEMKPEKQVAAKAGDPAEIFKPTYQGSIATSAGAAGLMQSQSGGAAKDIVKELRQIRQVSIVQHRETLAKLGGPKAI